MALSRFIRCAGLAIAAACLLSVAANAHGVFPQAVSFSKDPSNPDRYWVGTSFGLVTSTDAGKTWSWICEEAANYDGYEPTLVVTQDGSVVLGAFDGLRASFDGGCTWTVPENTPDQMVAALHPEDREGRSVLALFSMYADQGYKNQVWQSGDNARTWTQLGQDVDPSVLLNTLRSAPGDPDVLYVSGKRIFEDFTSEHVVFRSQDRAQTWQEVAIPAGGAVRILAVHPTNSAHVFAHVQSDGAATEESLWHSLDQGDTWTELHTGQARLFGFEFSPDLQEIWVGYGVSLEFSAEKDHHGVWAARLDDPKFERVMDGPIGCLTQTEDALFVCTRQFYHRFELGRASSPRAELEPLWELDRLEGVLECQAGTDVARICPFKWPETCALTSQCAAEENGPTGGTGNASEEDGTPSDAHETAPPAPAGCGCRAAGTSTHPPSALWIPAALALAAGLWRRRRKSRPPPGL